MASDKELNIGIKVTANTSGAKEATKAIDGLTDAIEEQAVAEKELVQETEKVVVEEKKLVEVEKEATAAVVGVTHAFKDQEKIAETLGASLKKTSLATAELGKATMQAKESAAQFISANAYGKFDDTLLKAHDAMRKTTVSANGAAQATKELGTKNSNAAMGVMALSNAFQDAQYGMAGMINNIPMIVTGMGLGMGVAGAVQAAAVGVQILTKNFDIFGTEAKAVAKDATEAANEATALAASTQRVADATANATEKQKEFSSALKETEENFKAVAKESDKAIEAARRLQDIETKRADLQSDLALAEVDVQLASGQISSEDANAKRAGIRAQRDAKAAALAEKTLADTQKAEEERAKAAEAAAKAQKEILRTKLTDQRAAGLLSTEDRKIELGRLDAAEKEAEAATKRMEADKADQEKTEFLRKAAEAAGDKMYVTDEEIARLQRIELDKNTAQTQYGVAQQSRGILAGDAAARFRTGAKSLEDFNARRSAAESAVAESTRIAEEARGRAGIAGEDLGLAREATATRAKIAAMRQAGAAASSAQSGYGIGFTGPIPPQGFAVDQKEAEKAAKEAEGANRSNTAATIKIIRALAGELKLTKEQLSALTGVVDDIRTTK